MRVFVTGVGRIGSVSFREACRHATNYTTGHETKCGLLEYPDQFIEVSPHIRCCIVHLARKYTDAKWVHLVRDAGECIKSLARLDQGAVMRAYAVLHGSVMPSDQPADIAYRYYWAENDLIDAQLTTCVKSMNRMRISLEEIKGQWRSFWNFIEAEGDFDASLAAWDIKRNTAAERLEL